MGRMPARFRAAGVHLKGRDAVPPSVPSKNFSGDSCCCNFCSGLVLGIILVLLALEFGIQL